MKIKILVALSIMILIASSFPVNIVHAQLPTVTVTRVYWGSAQPTPGDVNVPLNIVIQNDGTEQITYLNAQLLLNTLPFTDSATGAYYSTAGYSDTLKPGQSTTLTFYLNIASDATIKTYDVPLELKITTPHYLSVVDIPLTVKVPLLGKAVFSLDAAQASLPSGNSQLDLILSNSGTGSASAVQVSLSIPTSIALTGQSNVYIVDSLSSKTNFTLPVLLYIPRSSEGSAYSITAVISYSDPYGTTRSETHIVGFSIEESKWLSPFTLYSDTNNFTAGYMNRPTITIKNTGKSSVNSVEVVISTQPTKSSTSTTSVNALTITPGTESWVFEDIKPSMSVTITPEVFAPLDSADSSHTMTLSITYFDSNGNLHEETKTIGFAVKGSIIIVFQQVQVSPTTISAGGNFTITGNLLNKGNTDALYSTISIKPNSYFNSSLEGSQYIGDITTNNPIPFSLTVGVPSNVGEGTHPVTAVLTYEDNYGKTYSEEFTMQVSISRPTAPHTQTQEAALGTTALFRILFLTALVAIVGGGSISVFKVYRGRKRTKET